MAQVLLTSEKFVKSVTNIDDNIAGKFLQPSIREAQDVKLREILGGALLQRLKSLVAEDTIGEPVFHDYQELLDECQYYLAYTAIVDVMNKQYKIANAGVVKTPDDRVNTATDTELYANIAYYQSKADSYAYLLQTWLLQNRTRYPELTYTECCRLRSNLYSAATCGIWLGGPRGKRLPGREVKRSGKSFNNDYDNDYN